MIFLLKPYNITSDLNISWHRKFKSSLIHCLINNNKFEVVKKTKVDHRNSRAKTWRFVFLVNAQNLSKRIADVREHHCAIFFTVCKGGLCMCVKAQASLGRHLTHMHLNVPDEMTDSNLQLSNVMNTYLKRDQSWNEIHWIKYRVVYQVWFNNYFRNVMF